jgi:hypothetical protein
MRASLAVCNLMIRHATCDVKSKTQENWLFSGFFATQALPKAVFTGF